MGKLSCCWFLVAGCWLLVAGGCRKVLFAASVFERWVSLLPEVLESTTPCPSSTCCQLHHGPVERVRFKLGDKGLGG